MWVVLALGFAASTAFAGGDAGEGGGAQPDPSLRLEGKATPAPVERPAATPPPKPAPADPALRLPGGSGGDSSDSYQLTAQLDDGSVLLARILITNAGPGDRNAIATGLWIERDGTAHSFDNVRRSSEWKLSKNRKRFDIGSTHLDLSSDYARYWITKKRIQLDVQLPLIAGVSLPRDFEPVGAEAELLATLVPVLGTIKLRAWDEPRDIRGTATLLHGWSKDAAFGSARRISASASHGGESVLVLQQQNPGGASQALLVRRAADGELHLVKGLSAQAEGRLPGDRPNSYPAPAVLVLSGAQAEGRVLVGDVIFERDLIGSLPLPLRTVMGFALNLRPRRVWARASIEVTMRPVSGGTPSRFQGEGTATIAFSDTFSGR